MVSIIEQRIVRVFPSSVNVISGNLKEYNVVLSDKVRMTMNPEVDDIAVIKTFEDRWLVTDLIKYWDTLSDDEKLRIRVRDGLASEEEVKLYESMVEEELQEFEDLVEDY